MRSLEPAAFTPPMNTSFRPFGDHAGDSTAATPSGSGRGAPPVSLSVKIRGWTLAAENRTNAISPTGGLPARAPGAPAMAVATTTAASDHAKLLMSTAQRVSTTLDSTVKETAPAWLCAGRGNSGRVLTLLLHLRCH